MKVSQLCVGAACTLIPLIGFAADSYKSTDASADQYLTLDLYNGVSGTLSGASLTISYTYSGAALSVNNTTLNDITATGSTSATITGVSSTVSDLSTYLASQTTIYGSGYTFTMPTTSVLAGTTYSLNQTGTSTYTVTYDLSSILSSLYATTGTSTLNLSWTALFGSSSATSDSAITVSSTSPTITYFADITYTPVPEPSTYALLLGVGTMGLVGWRRFRRK